MSSGCLSKCAQCGGGGGDEARVRAQPLSFKLLPGQAAQPLQRSHGGKLAGCNANLGKMFSILH